MAVVGGSSPVSTEVVAEKAGMVCKKIVIADDGVWTYDFGENMYSAAIIISTNDGSPFINGIFGIRAATTDFATPIASNNISVSSGALTGTTGVDGELTLSCHTDHKVYIENRLGSNKSLLVTIMWGIEE